MATFAVSVAVTAGAAKGIERLVRQGLTPVTVGIGVLAMAVVVLVIVRLDWQALLEERRLRLVRSGA
jgi:hypothetical protein